MRLVLVHGINQQGKSEEALRRTWLGHLDFALKRVGAFDGQDVALPFYGDKLKELTDAGPGAVAQGAGGTADPDEAMFLAEALTEQAEAAGATRDEIRAAARQPAGAAVDQSSVMNRRVNALVRVLERISPLHGDLVIRVLGQAYAYLKQPGCGAAIDELVRPAFQCGPAVVVGHSLGTVVSFKLLRELALAGNPVEVPLFVTVGSPLSLMAVQKALGPEFLVPPGVGRWVNGVDPDDFIALGRGLDGDSFAAGIDDYLDIDNLEDDPHAIEGYLRDQRIATAIAEACRI